MADPLQALASIIGLAMRGQQVMPGIYDPTGQTFQNGRNVSTELNVIEGEPGRYGMYPSLTPNQVDIQNILQGRKMTPEQHRRAGDYAQSRDSEVPKFKTVKEARDYEQRRHQGLEAGYRPQNPNDLLAWLIQALSN